ncbi:peptide deformylase [Vagococcus zengguangii]|uniref:Peptide deformylase n=1 Tax=Vagococcus zengguangii TaxID=2571750 RepID=A0A4D7CUL5_9ENTE|nr:peptide deformylase [Vagococcus zengguangii]QCI86944.1 peptide deformylase [Vagococcus zengguangii]TLG81013.1 peptide deformylase [Vagococcus zengguangii]
MILMNDIIREGNPTLRETAKELTFPLSDEERQLAAEMLEFLKNSQDPQLAEEYDLRGGVGLAAPQLDIDKRMIAVHIPNPDFDENNPKSGPEITFSDVMVNPKVISHSVQLAGLEGGEGCLSVDRPVEGVVIRHFKITVTYFTVDGEAKKKKFKGYDAMVIQHEIDHLNGVMFYDRIDPKDPFAQKKDIILL